MKDSWKVVAILVCVLFAVSLLWQYVVVNSLQLKYADLEAKSAPAIAFFEQQQKLNTPPPAPDPADVKADDDPYTGEENAKATLIVFTDYQCPFCLKMHDSILAARKKFSGSDLRIVYRDFPLSGHSQALPAAKAAAAAGQQGKFWEMTDLLFINQTALSDDKFLELARQLKLDVSKFQAALTDPAIADEISQDQADGEVYGVTGTPGAFLDGVQIGGALEASALEAKIKEKL